MKEYMYVLVHTVCHTGVPGTPVFSIDCQQSTPLSESEAHTVLVPSVLVAYVDMIQSAA